MVLECGQIVGRYRLAERVGGSAQTDLWRAYDQRTQRDVAVKFSRQGATPPLPRLHYPGLLPILAHGEHAGRPYIVRPYIKGGSLRAQLDGRAWSPGRAIEVLAPLAAALDYLHQHGQTHGNLKPSNVLLLRPDRPLLTDALAVPPADLATGADHPGVADHLGLAIGSPAYAAPEQVAGAPSTAASDRYSLGVLAYVLLAGRPPFVGGSALQILLDQIVRQPAPPRALNPQLPVAAERALLAMLAKDPARRYLSGAAFVEALQEAGASQRGGFSRFLTSAAASNSLIPV